jgi:hypothetical protein
MSGSVGTRTSRRDNRARTRRSTTPVPVKPRDRSKKEEAGNVGPTRSGAFALLDGHQGVYRKSRQTPLGQALIRRGKTDAEGQGGAA